MYSSGFAPGILLFVAIYGALIALGFWIAYRVIKLAVRNGMKEHTLWLETRDADE